MIGAKGRRQTIFGRCFTDLCQQVLFVQVGDNLVREWRGPWLPISAGMGWSAAFICLAAVRIFMVAEFQWFTLLDLARLHSASEINLILHSGGMYWSGTSKQCLSKGGGFAGRCGRGGGGR